MTGAREGTPAEAPARPLLRVVRGTPSAEELAALTAVLVARSAASPQPPPPAGPGWRDLRGQLRGPVVAGPGRWVASGRVPGTRTRADW